MLDLLAPSENNSVVCLKLLGCGSPDIVTNVFHVSSAKVSNERSGIFSKKRSEF